MKRINLSFQLMISFKNIPRYILRDKVHKLKIIKLRLKKRHN